MSKAPKIGLRKRLALNLFAGIKKDLAKEHELREIFWECTLRCNLNCGHCGSDCRSSATVPDMPAEDFLRAIDQITPHVNPNRVMIVITGGEALCRKDLETVGYELYKRGYPWGIVTNGMLLTRERMDSLVRAGLRSITLSLDGFEEAHNAIRRHPLSWRNAVRALDVMIATKGIVYDVVTCVGPHNYSSLPDLREWLIERGCKAWRLFTIFPVGRAADNDALQLSPEEYRGLMEFIKSTRKEGRIKCDYACEGFLGGYEAEVRDRFFGCMAGVSICGIKIDGAISACTSIRAGFDQGNIYTDDIWEVWNTRPHQHSDGHDSEEAQRQLAIVATERHAECGSLVLHEAPAEPIANHIVAFAESHGCFDRYFHHLVHHDKSEGDSPQHPSFQLPCLLFFHHTCFVGLSFLLFNHLSLNAATPLRSQSCSHPYIPRRHRHRSQGPRWCSRCSHRGLDQRSRFPFQPSS